MCSEDEPKNKPSIRRPEGESRAVHQCLVVQGWSPADEQGEKRSEIFLKWHPRVTSSKI